MGGRAWRIKGSLVLSVTTNHPRGSLSLEKKVGLGLVLEYKSAIRSSCDDEGGALRSRDGVE